MLLGKNYIYYIFWHISTFLNSCDTRAKKFFFIKAAALPWHHLIYLLRLVKTFSSLDILAIHAVGCAKPGIC